MVLKVLWNETDTRQVSAFWGGVTGLNMNLQQLLLVLLMTVGPVMADSAVDGEYRLKAAYLYNFAKFVEWPPNALATETSPIVIAVFGDNPFGASLDQVVNGRTVNGHPVTVRYVHRPAELEGAHLVFVSRNVRTEILGQLAGKSVLTVGEGDGFLPAGGMIQFVVVENRVRFAIAEPVAQRAGLKISSQLLALAVPEKGAS